MHPSSTSNSFALQNVTPLAFAALIAANVALSFGSWFVRLADTGPVAAGFWRLTIAAPLLFAGAAATGWRPVRLAPAAWIALAVAGVCFAADLGSWHIGILKTTLANATLFGNASTLIYPIYGFFIARAWPSRTQGLALLMAAAGATLLMGRSYELDLSHLTGDLLCLLAGALYSVYLILMARLRRDTAPLPALAMATTASVAPMLALALLLGEQILPHDWRPVVALALLSQVFGQTLLIYALGRLPPLVIGIAFLVQPIVAASVGWIVYAERPGIADAIGAVLVAIALLLVRRPAA